MIDKLYKPTLIILGVLLVAQIAASFMAASSGKALGDLQDQANQFSFQNSQIMTRIYQAESLKVAAAQAETLGFVSPQVLYLATSSEVALNLTK
ncbi:hypothetical protein HY404_00615 [Candidatus Microgenomates bacterium]|nr:hypothetical protein [Candidatus Microgenomates bacterium]